MSQYKVGEKVEFLESGYTNEYGIVGGTGTITMINECSEYDYEVEFYHPNRMRLLKEYFYEKELKSIEPLGQEIIDYGTYKVIFSKLATIVVLNTGERGVTKCLSTDTYDKNKGMKIAYLKAIEKRTKKELNKATKIQLKILREYESTKKEIKLLCK